MIETNRRLARLNSALCCQIANFFDGLGADVKALSAWRLGASRSSELWPVQAMRMIAITARRKCLAHVKARLLPKDSGN
jgi:hypothetical protein